MPISMFLKANVQRLRSYQKLNRLNSLSVLDEVISLSMSHGHSTTHCGDARLRLERTSSKARVLWRKVVPRVCD